MSYLILAKAVSFFHALILFAFFQGIRFLRWEKQPRLFALHRGGLVLMSVGNIIAGNRCPITVLQEYLRKLDNPAYEMPNGFVGGWFEDLGMDWLPGTINCLVGGAIHFTAALAILECIIIWRRHKRRPNHAET